MTATEPSSAKNRLSRRKSPWTRVIGSSKWRATQSGMSGMNCSHQRRHRCGSASPNRSRNIGQPMSNIGPMVRICGSSTPGIQSNSRKSRAARTRWRGTGRACRWHVRPGRAWRRRRGRRQRPGPDPRARDTADRRCSRERSESTRPCGVRVRCRSGAHVPTPVTSHRSCDRRGRRSGASRSPSQGRPGRGVERDAGELAHEALAGGNRMHVDRGDRNSQGVGQPRRGDIVQCDRRRGHRPNVRRRWSAKSQRRVPSRCSGPSVTDGPMRRAPSPWRGTPPFSSA